MTKQTKSASAAMLEKCRQDRREGLADKAPRPEIGSQPTRTDRLVQAMQDDGRLGSREDAEQETCHICGEPIEGPGLGVVHGAVHSQCMMGLVF